MNLLTKGDTTKVIRSSESIDEGGHHGVIRSCKSIDEGGHHRSNQKLSLLTKGDTTEVQMQCTNVTLFARVIICFREYPLSKCKIQMRHYGIVYFMVESITPTLFANAKYRCDIIYWCYFML